MSNLISRKALLCSRRPFLIAPSNYRRLSSRTSPLQSTYTGSPTSASAASDVLHPIQSNTDSTSKSATMPKISPLSILPLSNVVRSLVINTISSSPKSPGANIDVEKCVKNEVLPWAEGTLATVRLAGPGDFVSIKVTGAGSLALQALEAKGVCHDTLKKAIDDICALGAERGVKLAFDAEHAAVQAGIDLWTLKYMKRYNKPGKGGAVIYGTYQAYLKACPQVVANHMAIAQKENFTLGVKLVRGAYMGSDPRELIHDTKRETDECYDGIAEALIRQTPNAILKPENGAEKTFQAVDLALAGHNLESVRKAQVIRTEQAEKGEERIELCYAQLQGMADEVSCELVAEGKLAESMNSSHAQDSKVTVHGGINELIGGTKGGKDQLHLKTDIPKAYKYLTWGTTGECMKYLLRRAYENRDAVGRTREGRNEMGRELVRRVKGVFGA
ncbi:hypothetical protein BELL_0052g00170 [Botrytis elliptica]|uniref:Proline dehydrogenase n=1 Tax=Botrytis elliptica TaxID=278938 RepID=A0A4Z1K5S3_9HELO|nr:hypothetical protein BELL_0052g00170 [Botrytis elliptica]